MTGFSRLLIVTAMAEEEAALRRELAGASLRSERVGGGLQVDVHDYALDGREVSVVRSGVGPVNAALALAAVANARPLDAVILLGVGGSVSPALAIGDLVVSRRVLQHDSFSSLDFGDPRMRPGDYLLTEADVEGHLAHFDADARLIDLLVRDETASVGTVLSGSEFAGTVSRKHALRALDPEALLVEMEGAGIAQTATRLGLPFVVAKTVADRLHPDGSIEQDFTACLDAAAKNAARVLRRCLAAA